MVEFIKFPSIGKIKDAQHNVAKKCKPQFSGLTINDDGSKTPNFTKAIKPVLTFYGTVKLHGTNACVVIDKNQQIFAQSRTRILNLNSDNAGFCAWTIAKKDAILQLYYDNYSISDEDLESVYIFGEWCGENIQSNVALMGIKKTFVIFNVLVITLKGQEIWLDKDSVKKITDPENNIYNIHEFQTYEVEIDFDNTEKGFMIIDRIRDEVDAVCPVAKALGSTSKTTVGEGIVWRCITEGWEHISFKHKGESHRRSGDKPNKQTVSKNLTEEQKVLFDKFLDEALSVDRLAQGIEYLTENNIEVAQKNTGVYLKWVSEDILKECEQELAVLIENDIDWKSIQKPLSGMAREFLFNKIDELDLL